LAARHIIIIIFIFIIMQHLMRHIIDESVIRNWSVVLVQVVFGMCIVAFILCFKG